MANKNKIQGENLENGTRRKLRVLLLSPCSCFNSID